MSRFTNAMRTASSGEAGAPDHSWDPWYMAGLALLSVRFIQGWIYWGGGSRRFIYDIHKIEPHGHWLADKFQSAMPGALLGTDHVIAFLLHHFVLLYASLVAFSAAELIGGLMLITGLLTRIAAAVSVVLSLLLMLTFGWQGATCMDEWTMAASNLAMGVTLVLAGGGALSVDNALLRRFPALAGRGWFRWMGGSLPPPLRAPAFRRAALALTGFAAVFNVATYSYYRGAVVTPYHHGPVSPTTHHLTLGNGEVRADGWVRFHVYVDGGTAAVPSHIVDIALVQPDGTALERWDMPALAALPATAVSNDFPYRKFRTGHFGLIAPVGAAATLALPPAGHAQLRGPLALRLTTVDEKVFELSLAPAANEERP